MSLLLRVLVLLAVSVPLLLGGLVTLRTLPLGAEAAGLREAVAEEARALESDRSEAAAWETWQSRERPVLEAGERLIEGLVGTGSRVADVLPLVADLAWRTGVTVLGLAETPVAPGHGKADQPEAGRFLDRLRLTIDVEGPPERVLEFLGSLGKASRPITVTEVEVFRHERAVLDVAALVTVDVVVRAQPGAESR